MINKKGLEAAQAILFGFGIDDIDNIELSAAVTAYEAALWQPITEYIPAEKFHPHTSFVWCHHDTEKWYRVGQFYPELKRWYYSGTTERSQYAQTEGGEPTHWRQLPTMEDE